MKSTTYCLAILLILPLVFLNQNSNAQEKSPNKLPPLEKHYSYDSVPNDPTHTRIYSLDNGLKIYISIYKNEPRIYTSIPVRVGSKNDPSNATGLAHYLEHMLFKGTDQYGTNEFSKEKVELQKIDSLYDIYGTQTDTIQRKKTYHKIDSISQVASKYSIANEYDKMMSNLGAKGTNAYTGMEQTVYINDIPTNQLHKWLLIEGERFRNPIMRLFHTELEAVYEEKNRNLDDDYAKLDEATNAGLFQKHPYGTQTTIGTIEHLKNPSLKKIKEYLKTYYVPNNMAICLAGDLNPDSTIKWIDQTFGALLSGPVPTFNSPIEEPISAPIIKNVIGPFPETLCLAFRLPGAGTKEAELLELMSSILNNGNAGLIDLDLVQKQKVGSANCYPEIFNNYSAHIFYASPKEGQKLNALKDLLLLEIEKVKKGDFPEWLLSAIISNLKLQRINQYETNNGRVSYFVNAFIQGAK